MIYENFDYLVKVIKPSLEEKGFKVERAENLILFSGDNRNYRVNFLPLEKMIYLEIKKCESENSDQDTWKRLLSWLFSEETSHKDIDFIAKDFVDAVSLKSFESFRETPKKRNNYSEYGSDALFFANRFVGFFPELKKEIFIEKESYNDFRGSVFTETCILPKITDFLINCKDDKKVEKLVKLICDLYKNSSLTIKSLITMGILNNITEQNQIDRIKKYLNNDVTVAWNASMKFKNKNIKPISKKSNLMHKILKI